MIEGALLQYLIKSSESRRTMSTSTTRAKFRCQSVESFSAAPEGQRAYRFTAEYDASLPEDRRYARYTPSGELRIVVTNPAVSFELGASYYLDITPASADED